MINLLPDDMKEDFSFGRKNNTIIKWLSTVVFGIIVLLIVAAVGRLTIQTARNQAVVQKETVEQQLKTANYDSINTEYTNFVDSLGNVRKLYQQQILYSRLIRKLGAVLPPGAKITNISIGDKDKAIGLNFDNDSEGLGSTIQLNLTDQSNQTIDKTRAVFGESLQIPVVGKLDPANQNLPIIEKNIDKKTILFYVNAKNSTLSERLTSSLKNGGEMAFATVYDTLNLPENKNLNDFNIITNAIKTSGGTLTEESRKFIASANATTTNPQIRGYKVDTDQKSVDFTVRADSIAEAKSLEKVLLNSKNTLFIEMYTFDDYSYVTKEKCIDSYTEKTTCLASGKLCTSDGNNGCQYTVRAYYDELFTTASAKPASDSEKKNCIQGGSVCTHTIEASYSQLFSNVDINRVATCTKDATNGTTTCPVEMRAEFSADSKFYLINPAGVSK